MTDPNQNNPFNPNAGQQTPAYQGANVPPAAPAAPAYGAPQAPAPQASAPQYAAPQTQPYQATPATNNKTNGFAVAALIFGLLGGILGLIFGIIALNQIKKNGGKGKGLAIAGIVLFIVWIPISIVLNMDGGTSAMALALAL